MIAKKLQFLHENTTFFTLEDEKLRNNDVI